MSAKYKVDGSFYIYLWDSCIQECDAHFKQILIIISTIKSSLETVLRYCSSWYIQRFKEWYNLKHYHVGHATEDREVKFLQDF